MNTSPKDLIVMDEIITSVTIYIEKHKNGKRYPENYKQRNNNKTIYISWFCKILNFEIKNMIVSLVLRFVL